jgi:DNA-binding MarR family transcriptional regulator
MINYDFKKSTVYNIGKAHLAIRKKGNSLIKSQDGNVTTEQFDVLHLICEQEGLTQREIAEELSKDKANITRTLDVMHKNELIKRSRDENDRRVYKIFLTEKGKKLEEKLIPAIREINKKITRGITKEELEEFTRILKIIQDNLEK